MSSGRVDGVLVDLPKSLAPAELAQKMVCVLLETCEVEGSGHGFNAVEPPRLPVIDRVGSHEVGHLEDHSAKQVGTIKATHKVAREDWQSFRRGHRRVSPRNTRRQLRRSEARSHGLPD